MIKYDQHFKGMKSFANKLIFKKTNLVSGFTKKYYTKSQMLILLFKLELTP